MSRLAVWCIIRWYTARIYTVISASLSRELNDSHGFLDEIERLESYDINRRIHINDFFVLLEISKISHGIAPKPVLLDVELDMLNTVVV